MAEARNVHGRKEANELVGKLRDPTYIAIADAEQILFTLIAVTLAARSFSPRAIRAFAPVCDGLWRRSG